MKKPPKLSFVREVNGAPVVRWRSVLSLVLWFAGGMLISALVANGLGYDQEVLVLFGLPLCGLAASVVLRVELERHFVRTGEWRVRFSLRALFTLSAIAAVFFAVLGHSLREQRRSRAADQLLVADLEAVLQGGQAFIYYRRWRDGVGCIVAHASFSDDDLARVIDLSSQGGARPCRLTYLDLAGTSVTSAGVRRLAECQRLAQLSLPPLDLSQDAIDALANCGGLEFLTMGEQNLTREKIIRMLEAMPNVQINGRTRKHPGL